jgi:hypothetical protein
MKGAVDLRITTCNLGPACIGYHVINYPNPLDHTGKIPVRLGTVIVQEYDREFIIR